MQNEGNNQARSGLYVLDSYALLACLEAEPGGGRVRELLETAQKGNYRLFMCAVNLGEVVYIVERERGLPKAQETLALIDELPLEIVDADRSLTLAAAHIKANCPVAYADCFAAALSQSMGAILVTGDPEFNKINQEYYLRIEWI